jgi:hypothetical protein
MLCIVCYIVCYTCIISACARSMRIESCSQREAHAHTSLRPSSPESAGEEVDNCLVREASVPLTSAFIQEKERKESRGTGWNPNQIVWYQIPRRPGPQVANPGERQGTHHGEDFLSSEVDHFPHACLRGCGVMSPWCFDVRKNESCLSRGYHCWSEDEQGRSEPSIVLHSAFIFRTCRRRPDHDLSSIYAYASSLT